MKILICMIFSLVSLKAPAISQVGPKTLGSDEQGFSLLLPLRYPSFLQLNSAELRVREFTMNSSINISDSYHFMPFLKFVGKELPNEHEVESHFESENWFEILTDDCRRSYIHVSSTSVRGVSTWGANKGVAIIGPRSTWVQKNIIQMLQDLVLLTEEGMCLWK